MFFKAYNGVCKYSFICLTETYIGFLISSDYVFLDLEGYKVVHADHSNNIKRGRACIYYKKSLAVRVINFPYLQEALLRKSNDHNKRTYDIKSLLLSQIKQRRIWKLSKFAARSICQWKAISFLSLLYFFSYCFFMEISNRTLDQKVAEIIYHHFVTGTLMRYQHVTLQRCFYSI